MTKEHLFANIIMNLIAIPKGNEKKSKFITDFTENRFEAERSEVQVKPNMVLELRGRNYLVHDASARYSTVL